MGPELRYSIKNVFASQLFIILNAALDDGYIDGFLEVLEQGVFS